MNRWGWPSDWLREVVLGCLAVGAIAAVFWFWLAK
jgi:hypothetical protein